MMGMEVEKKSNVVFGTMVDREMFPLHWPQNRFGNEDTPIRGVPHRGPGLYNSEEFNNLQYNIGKRITSMKGYSLGARTAARFPKISYEKKRLVYDLTNFKSPGPPTYQANWTDPIEFTTSYKPFNVTAERFAETKAKLEDVNPGPGTYDHTLDTNRKVMWHQAFGGNPINLPSVSQQSSIPKNTEKLMSTKDEKKYHRRLAYLKLYYE